MSSTDMLSGSLDKNSEVKQLAYFVVVSHAVRSRLFSRLFVVPNLPPFKSAKLIDCQPTYTVYARLTPSGLTEDVGRENGGPSKLQGMKLMDQCAGREIAGRENDGPICRT